MRLKTPIFSKVLQCIMRWCRQSVLLCNVKHVLLCCGRFASLQNNNTRINLMKWWQQTCVSTDCHPPRHSKCKTVKQRIRFVWFAVPAGLFTCCWLTRRLRRCWASQVHHGTWSSGVSVSLSHWILKPSSTNVYTVDKQWRIYVWKRRALILRQLTRNNAHIEFI